MTEDDGTFPVQQTQCTTCIYKKQHRAMLPKLEAQIADPHLPGYFKGWRICHSTRRGKKSCCRGFWNRHKDHFTLGQLAQRLGLVRFVREP